MAVTPTIYRVIAKDDITVKFFRSTWDLSIYLLGRRLSAYLVIKSDAAGDRLITFTDAEFNAIPLKLEDA